MEMCPRALKKFEVVHDVERLRAVITSDPAMSANELAEVPGVNSALNAQTVKVDVNAHKSAEEEDEACSHEYELQVALV